MGKGLYIVRKGRGAEEEQSCPLYIFKLSYRVETLIIVGYQTCMIVRIYRHHSGRQSVRLVKLKTNPLDKFGHLFPF